MKLKSCKICGEEFEVVSSRKYCSDNCYIKAHTKTFTCKYCGEDFERVVHGKTTYEICGASCRGKYARSLNNPMNDPKTREKVSRTMKKAGHKPKKQGGNGKGITKPQRILADKLGEGWVCEYAQGIKGPRNIGYPPNYKIDIANPVLKIAIEVDGKSHSTIIAKERDAKKENKLGSLGWRVIRFTNDEILNNVDSVVKEICNLME